MLVSWVRPYWCCNSTPKHIFLVLGLCIASYWTRTILTGILPDSFSPPRWPSDSEILLFLPFSSSPYIQKKIPKVEDGVFTRGKNNRIPIYLDTTRSCLPCMKWMIPAWNHGRNETESRLHVFVWENIPTEKNAHPS